MAALMGQVMPLDGGRVPHCSPCRAGPVICAGVGALLFGFRRGTVLGAGALTLVLAVVAVGSLIRTIRNGPSAADEGGDAAPEAAEPDWLSTGEVEARVTGTRRRYLARFAILAPAVEAMGREERRIAAALRFLGMPESTVGRCGRGDPQRRAASV
ncbi:hypothetical protein ABT369_13380 [Dactylosporangium sp. NPDC000244]|uniref:hypothetical protein n=1 Tax=Dactylosporangium sp. NPDC000244 TaxID=3154365 RepID=UPI0033275FE9